MLIEDKAIRKSIVKEILSQTVWANCRGWRKDSAFSFPVRWHNVFMEYVYDSSIYLWDNVLVKSYPKWPNKRSKWHVAFYGETCLNYWVPFYSDLIWLLIRSWNLLSCIKNNRDQIQSLISVKLHLVSPIPPKRKVQHDSWVIWGDRDTGYTRSKMQAYRKNLSMLCDSIETEDS